MNGMQRAWIEINLDRIENNIKAIRQKVGNKTKIMAAVKADAYGHGCVQVSKCLLENGADYLAVACVDEAIELREHGIEAPILVLGKTFPDEIEKLLEYDISATVCDAEFTELLSESAVKMGKSAKIHIKIDTGMGRIGFRFDCDCEKNEQKIDEIAKICSMNGIYTEGIYTHFAKSDEEDKAPTLRQFEIFMDVNEKLKARGIDIELKHCCNSAAIIRFPEMHLDMVRPGIILYGLYPSEHCKDIAIMPAMQLKARATYIKEVDEGAEISYGGIYTTKDKTKIATVSLGYGDGYPRGFSNRSEMLIGGQRVPVLGKICMDQCMIDITKVNNISVGDVVTAMGTDNGQEITADELAQLDSTISYEIVCRFKNRVPKIYYKNNTIAE